MLFTMVFSRVGRLSMLLRNNYPYPLPKLIYTFTFLVGYLPNVCLCYVQGTTPYMPKLPGLTQSNLISPWINTSNLAGGRKRVIRGLHDLVFLSVPTRSHASDTGKSKTFLLYISIADSLRSFNRIIVPRTTVLFQSLCWLLFRKNRFQRIEG